MFPLSSFTQTDSRSDSAVAMNFAKTMQMQNKPNDSLVNSGDLLSNMQNFSARQLTQENLSSLEHSRQATVKEISSVGSAEKLQVQLGKYQQWEISTQIQLTRQGLNLEEAVKTIDMHRKSILDLQLQSEALSQTLVEKQTKADQVSEQIKQVAGLCEFLRHCTSDVEERVAACEQVKNELCKTRLETASALESLTKKFEDLELEHLQVYSDVKSEFDATKSKNLAMKTEFLQKCKTADEKINDANKELDAKDCTIQALTTELQSHQDKLMGLINEKEDLQGQLEHSITVRNSLKGDFDDISKKRAEVEALLLEKDDALQQVTQELHQMRMDNTDLQEERERLREQRVELQELHSLERNKVNEQLQNLEDTNKDCKLRIDLLESEYKILEETLAAMMTQKDSLTSENCSLKKNLKELEIERSTLLNSCNDYESRSKAAEEVGQTLTEKDKAIEDLKADIQIKIEAIETLKLENEQMRNDLDSKSNVLESLKDENENLITKCDDIEEQKTQLENHIDSLNKEIVKERYENDHAKEEIKSLQRSIQKLEEEVEEMRMNLNASKDQSAMLQEEKSVYQTEVMEAQEQMEKYRSETEDLKRKLSIYTKQAKSSDSKLIKYKSKLEKIESRTKMYTELSSEAKELKQANAEYLKCIEKLNEKLNSLKEQLKEATAKNEKLSVNLTNIKSEESSLKSIIHQLSNDKDLSMKTSKETRVKITDLETALKEKENKIKLLENEVKDKEKQLSDALVKNEDDRKELMSVMERYKIGNQDIIKGQYNDIDNLNKKIENLKIDHEIVLKKKDAELDKLQLANKKLEESLAAINNVKKTPATPQVNTERSILKDKPTPIESRKRVTFTCEQNDSETSASDCMEVDLAAGCLDKKKGTGSTATPGLPSLRLTPTRSLINSVFKDPKPTPRGKPVDVSPKAKKPKTTGGALTRRRGSQDCLSPAHIIKNTEVKQPLTPMTKRPLGNKFFKTPQSARKTYSSKTKSDDFLTWFDENSPYGFNNED